MLDDYKEKFGSSYEILKNEILLNQVGHAYLFDENNNTESFNMVMAFVKELLCSKLNSDDEKKNLCKRIDDGNYPEIKIIRPDGMLIKKQQIMDLQQDFSRVAIEGNIRIYVIFDCDKMRAETANSMLKFLEEPDNNIVAILMTNNYNNILQTIVSRCQIIRLGNGGLKKTTDEFETMALNFIKTLENKGMYTIIDEQKLLFDSISVKERDKLTLFFDRMIDIYYDIMKIKSGKEISSDYYDELLAISDKIKYSDILNRIDLLISKKDSIKYNVNTNLLIDSLIVDIGG